MVMTYISLVNWQMHEFIIMGYKCFPLIETKNKVDLGICTKNTSNDIGVNGVMT